jgi:hypothetical protein
MTKSRTNSRCIDGRTAFVVCSSWLAAIDEANQDQRLGERTMTGFSIKTILAAVALTALASAAGAQSAAPTPWVLSPDMGYAYDRDGKTFSYKMGTGNAKDLLKGAKKVPKGTLFFIGENGQLYMRSGPYLEGDGRFKFGPG